LELFGADQLREIRLGLISGVDVQKYMHPDIHSGEMEELRLWLESRIDIRVVFEEPSFVTKKLIDAGIDFDIVLED